MPAIVTADVARDRRRLGAAVRTIAEVKRLAHRRHRAAWRAWCHTGADEDREPTPRPGTGWEVW